MVLWFLKKWKKILSLFPQQILFLNDFSIWNSFQFAGGGVFFFPLFFEKISRGLRNHESPPKNHEPQIWEFFAVLAQRSSQFRNHEPRGFRGFYAPQQKNLSRPFSLFPAADQRCTTFPKASDQEEQHWPMKTILSQSSGRGWRTFTYFCWLTFLHADSGARNSALARRRELKPVNPATIEIFAIQNSIADF